MTPEEAPVVTAALRTPIGTAGRSLAGVGADRLAATVLAELPGRAGLSPGDVDEVVLGNCMGPGGDLARVAALTAGLPARTPALTVDRQCASGLAAIDVAARSVRTGADVVLAGGVESASTAPWRSWPPVDGGEAIRYTRAPFAPEGQDPDMGPANDLLAEEAGVSQERQDAYAARSHARAVAAQREGAYDHELVAVGDVAHDERPRAGLGVDRLARFRPTFRPGGSVTVGNSCGISDGAAVVALLSPERWRSGRRPGLQVLATATAGVDPTRPGRGIVPAAREALDLAGVGLDDLAAVELTEAFAGQVLACCDELDLDPERVCREGGALALGHPWGASGAILLVRLFHQLVRRGPGHLGLAAIAAGGGQGVAMVVRSC